MRPGRGEQGINRRSKKGINQKNNKGVKQGVKRADEKKELFWLLLSLLLLLVGSTVLSGCQKGTGEARGGEMAEREPLSSAKDSAAVPAHPSFVSVEELAQVLASPQQVRDATRQTSDLPQALDGQQGSDIQQALDARQVRDETIVAGVVPHHLVAGALIAELMEAIAGQEPEVIILVGPNHYNEGGRIISGYADWQTPLGLVRTERQLVQAFLETNLAVRDEAVLDKEHAVGNLMPLIKKFLPDVQVVPLILHHDVALQEVDELLDFLEPLLTEKKALLLASVDFSHYLTGEKAKEKDRFTLQVMRNFDYPTLFRLGNDYLDSPASLAMVFRWAERKGLKNFTVLGNTNSGELFQDQHMETTSYFTLLFGQKTW